MAYLTGSWKLEAGELVSWKLEAGELETGSW